MTRSELPDDVQAATLRRRARFWFRIAMSLTIVSLSGQIAFTIIRWTEPRPPTMHTRRICHGDGQVGYEHDCVRIEIFDGQCATALGVPVKAR